MLTPIERRKISVAAIRQLQEAIQRGDYPVGTRLPPERELAQQFNISRPSVREALRFLEALGLVTSITGRGTFVTNSAANPGSPQLDLENPVNIIEAREALEAGTAEKAAERRTEDDLTAMRRLLQEMDAPGIGVATFLELDMQFHLQIARATHNPVLVQLMEIVSGHMRSGPWHQIKARSSIFHKRIPQLQRDHQRLFKAIERGDGPLARSYMMKHLSTVMTDFTPQ